MKRICGYAFMAGLLCLSSADAFAVKARQGLIDFTQPDGTEIRIQLFGDETFHYAATPGGELLLPGVDGRLEYAVKDKNGVAVASGVSASLPVTSLVGTPVRGNEYATKILANSQNMLTRSGGRRVVNRAAAEAGIPKYRYESCAFPASGSPHSLVVIVEYQDVPFTVSNPQEYFQEFLNGEDFNKDGGTGSCRQYFTDNSNGIFTPTFDVYGPVKLSQNRKYYGGGNEFNANQMVVEAVKFLDDMVDFSQYDHNDDGYVDSIYIIYAGQGEADGGPAESVWPYSWDLEEERVYLEADGVKFNAYGCSNEIDGKRKPAGIGTFTHEFCHVLGLPDLYNTNNDYDPTTPLTWSVLDNGPYNNDGRTPPNMSSFERYSLGWLNPDEIVKSGNYELPYLADNNSAYIMTTEENPDEFYIMDYRLLEGWDLYLPYHGMLIWHIDFQQSRWTNNTPNNTRSHQLVDLVRADDMKDMTSLDGDPFPGRRKQKTEFSFTSTPALKSWGGAALNVTSISDIREEGRSAYFTATVSENREGENTGIGLTPDAMMQGFRVEGNRIFADSGAVAVYDITGRLIASATPQAPAILPAGLYIVGGRKILVK